MPNPRNQARNLLDGSGITHYNLIKFMKAASEDLKKEGQEDAAFYFEQVEDWLKNHYVPSKSFVYESRILGL